MSCCMLRLKDFLFSICSFTEYSHWLFFLLLHGRKDRYIKRGSSKRILRCVWREFGRVSKVSRQINHLEKLVLEPVSFPDPSRASIAAGRETEIGLQSLSSYTGRGPCNYYQLLPFFSDRPTGAWTGTTALSATMQLMHLLKGQLRQDSGSWDVIGVGKWLLKMLTVEQKPDEVINALQEAQRNKMEQILTFFDVLCAKLCWTTGFHRMVMLAHFLGKVLLQAAKILVWLRQIELVARCCVFPCRGEDALCKFINLWRALNFESKFLLCTANFYSANPKVQILSPRPNAAHWRKLFCFEWSRPWYTYCTYRFLTHVLTFFPDIFGKEEKRITLIKSRI